MRKAMSKATEKYRSNSKQTDNLLNCLLLLELLKVSALIIFVQQDCQFWGVAWLVLRLYGHSVLFEDLLVVSNCVASNSIY